MTSRPRREDRRRQPRANRRGTAAVEFAVCLPLLCTLVFGSIQACNLLFLKHALTAAVYEGTLEASKDNATRTTVRDRAQSILAAYGVEGATVSLSPSFELHNMAPGTELTITVSAPAPLNLPGPEIVVPSSTATSTGVTLR